MSEPRFKPGDFVVLKAQCHARWLYPDNYRYSASGILQVLESTHTVWPGGDQVRYSCRACTGEVTSCIAMYEEIELDQAPTKPAPRSGSDG